MISKSLLILITSTFLLISCGRPYKAYLGPKKSASEVARIQTKDGAVSDQLFNSLMGMKNDHRISIRFVNEREVSDDLVEVIPGNCNIKLSYSDKPNIRSKGFLSVSFEAEAGHTYVIGGFIKNDWTWKVSVVDSLNKKVVAEGNGELYVLGEFK
jgi:hypothetical protein